MHIPNFLCTFAPEFRYLCTIMKLSDLNFASVIEAKQMINLENCTMEDFTIHTEARKHNAAQKVARVGIYRRVNKPAYVHHQSSPLAEVL